MNHSFALRSTVATVLLAGAVQAWSADYAALAAQVEALRTAIAEQRTQLPAQLETLTKRLGQAPSVSQEVPKLTLTNTRPTRTWT